MQADLRSWLGLGAGVAVALLAIALGNIGHLVYLMDVHPGVAGWVQAIGAIIAIWAGFYQAARATARAEKREMAARRHARREALHATLTIAVSAGVQFHEGIEWLLRVQPDRDELKAAQSNLGGQIIALRSAPIGGVVNIAFIQAFTSLSGTLDYANSRMQDYLARPASRKDSDERRRWDALIDQLVGLNQISSKKVSELTVLSI
jgi:hypothetical protein